MSVGTFMVSSTAPSATITRQSRLTSRLYVSIKKIFKF
jgi:hypothetical protein